MHGIQKIPDDLLHFGVYLVGLCGEDKAPIVVDKHLTGKPFKLKSMCRHLYLVKMCVFGQNDSSIAEVIICMPVIRSCLEI